MKNIVNYQNVGKIALIVSLSISFASNLIFCIYINKSKKKYNIREIKISGFYAYIISMWVMNVSLIWNFNELNVKSQRVLSVIPIAGCIILICLKHILDEIIAKEHIDLEYEFLVRKRENDEKYYNLMKEYVNRLSVVRHDFMHQLQLAYCIVENNDNQQKCIELLDSMSEELRSTRPVMYCSNRIVNIILTMKIRELLKRNIKIDIDVILPGTLNIDDRTICNVINNMIDECMELKDLSKDRNQTSYMSFSMKKEDNRIILIMTIDISGIKEIEKYKSIRKYYDKYLLYVVEQCDGDVKYVERGQTLSIIVAVYNVGNVGGRMSYA